ncbi:MAG: S1C family serine protease [Candidatus Dormibacterales bacterium]
MAAAAGALLVGTACAPALGSIGADVHGSPTPAATSSPQGSTATTSQAAATLQDEFVDVVKSVSASVVQIQTSQGLGSGVVYDSKGDIVTNDHVVAGASSYSVTLADGRKFPARLVGAFAAGDLAVIRVSAPSLHPASFGDSSKLQVGDIVMAIGNPLGLQSSVTEGIVSALGRTVGEGNGVTLPGVIQSSAAINPGNSGGALVDLSGHVVGIPTLAAVDQQIGGSAPGIGFEIPSNTVVRIAGQLIKSGHVTSSGRAYLGVEIGSGVTFGGSGGNGVYVAAVVPGGPAAKAGIKAGDVITSLNGKPTPDGGTLVDVLAGLSPGRSVKVGLKHQDGSTGTVTVVLGQLPG